jgi:hypothetical protein
MRENKFVGVNEDPAFLGLYSSHLRVWQFKVYKPWYSLQCDREGTNVSTDSTYQPEELDEITCRSFCNGVPVSISLCFAECAMSRNRLLR